ncbi:PAS domain S-box-containing protein [Devosia lucknowensis]|uniref:PAS domain S-box-containing protein n=1 Tax=Devosia lucknowensis TaxID=1096929 RepID=A0A1Y6EST2_9HYPH|nr:LuxR C-terminal-related transcriptional regulator [Devosia lucknowensis]SMQ65774.1 PAS domain S-box-containing protein [Devosia lucknowensis]
MNREVIWDEKTSYFRKIAEETKILGWITDSDGYAFYFSSAWRDFAGVDPALPVGFDWLSFVHPHDTARVRRKFFDANDSAAEYGVSYRMRTKAGNYQLVWGHGVPRLDDEGNFQGYLGMTQTMEAYRAKAEAIVEAGGLTLIKPLSERERQVMTMAAEGLSNIEISMALEISERTVETHVRHSVEKLGANNRVHAVAKAIRLSVL